MTEPVLFAPDTVGSEGFFNGAHPIPDQYYEWTRLLPYKSTTRSFSTVGVPAAVLLTLCTWLAPSVAEARVSESTDPAPVVGKISIFNESIFDLSDPDENRALYRVANRLHITTRPAVLRQQLLFSPGDVLSQQALDESERILRSNRYIQKVSIKAVPGDDGIVNVDVHTNDSWTLIPKLSFSRKGGASKFGLGFKETNLLGSGMAVELSYKSDVDRDVRAIKFTDRNIGDSWYKIQALLEDNSDGFDRYLNIEKPFYSLTSTSAHGLYLRNTDRIDSFYDRGEITGQYRHREKAAEFYFGRSAGLDHGWVRRLRYGLAFEQHRFSPVSTVTAVSPLNPGNRRFAYPFVAFELLQDKFEKAKNYDQVNRTEDRFLGTRVTARLGFVSTNFGSDRDALLANITAETGFGQSSRSSLLLSTAIGSRWEHSGVQNVRFDAGARYYNRQSEHRMFFATVQMTAGRELDTDSQILLGGDNGLRGYPLRYQFGDKRALLTVEQRFYTDWFPWRLFHVGAAVFFDVGRAWGEPAVGHGKNEILRDIGFGLRIGNTRSGLGKMIHIDVAFPLDGGSNIKNMQFLVQTKRHF